MLLFLFLFFLPLPLGLMLIRLHCPIHKKLLAIIFVSWLGHCLGVYIFAVLMGGGDSLSYYFLLATPYVTKTFGVSGSGHMINLVWYIRDWLTGDSFIETMYFFNIFSFCGGILWYVLFLEIASIFNLSKRAFYRVPVIILLCWPTVMVFTANMKDAWTFFAAPLFFLGFFFFLYKSQKVRGLFLMLIAIWMIYFIRPYVIILLIGAFYFSALMNAKWSLVPRVIAGGIFFLVFLLIAEKLLKLTSGAVGLDYGSVMRRAAGQRADLTIGTTFPMTTNPALAIFLLPYSFLMNLCFPLFLFANNPAALLTSFENLGLIYLLYFFTKSLRNFWPILKKVFILRLLFFFFLLGLAFLGLINTNLGVAIREKAIYVSSLFVLISLVYVRFYPKKLQRV